VSIPDHRNEVLQADIDELAALAEKMPIPWDRTIVHNIPRFYAIDGGGPVVDPIGMAARTLTGNFRIIHGIQSRIDNAIRCLKEAEVKVEGIVFSPIACASAHMTHEEKSQGIILIDAGGGLTSYLAIASGAVITSGVIPLGGDHITQDMATGLRIPFSQAEKLKYREGKSNDGDTSSKKWILLKHEEGFS